MRYLPTSGFAHMQRPLGIQVSSITSPQTTGRCEKEAPATSISAAGANGDLAKAALERLRRLRRLQSRPNTDLVLLQPDLGASFSARSGIITLAHISVLSQISQHDEDAWCIVL